MSGRPTARNDLAPSVPAVSSLARDRRSGMVAPAAVWRDFALSLNPWMGDFVLPLTRLP